MNAVLCQTHSNGIAKTIQQERANADRTFDPPILSVPRLRHPKMQRIVPVGPLFLQRYGQQTVRLNHHLRIGGLHREKKVVKIQLSCDPRKLQCTFHHPVRRVPVPIHNPVGKRSMVCANADRNLALRTQFDQRSEGLLNPT